MTEGSPVEFMLVNRAPGWIARAHCGGCERETDLPFGLFVGSFGEACGAIDLCSDCAPLADRLARRIAQLTEGQATILFNEEAKDN